MNKTVTINISGIIFHIEEDAYDKLSKYLTTIKGYFKETEGRDEIVGDIESRIAEMLQAKVSPQKQVVLMSDVDQVIAIMGKPEDFAGENGEEHNADNTSASESTYNGKRRRIFRDPDDKILGGVCSGIAHYFGTDALWFRLALAISFFVFGFGFLFYILLWIIIPKAGTTAEKLEMKGETVNINNIHKSFTDEMDELKKRMQDLKHEASNLGTPEGKEKIRRGAGKVGSFLEEFFRMFGKIIGKFFAVIFIFIGISFLIALLASVFGYHTSVFHFGINDGGTTISFQDMFHLLFSKGQSVLLPFLALFLLLGVPFLMLIYHGIRILFSLGRSNKVFRIVAALLWTSGLILSMYLGYKASEEFAEHSSSSSNQYVKPSVKTLYIRMNNTEKTREDYESGRHRSDDHFLSWKGEEVCLGYPSLYIEQSRTDSFEVSITGLANGITEKEALIRARNIKYAFSVHDSVLELDPGYTFPVSDKWRMQRLHIVVKVPRNKVISLSRNTRPLIHHSDIANLQDTYDDDMAGRRWTMTQEGLDCLDCEGLKHHKHED
ncbi:MAG: PspC domain-containing protein [Bacteroidia bacterium]